MHHSLPIIDPAPLTPPPAPDAARGGQLRDAHGRTIRDLRLSVTDRCNYRCRYCMDPDHRYMPKQDLLSVDEYLTIARVAVDLGIEKIRITGGEPTLYPFLDELLEGLGKLGTTDLAMTTNGSLMTAAKAHRWRSLGLDRVTLSLDSLRPQRVAALTRARSASPEGTRQAISHAHEAGLGPVKVNAVVMRGVNDDELADFADFARAHAVDMRFIEWMPLDSGHTWQRQDVVSCDEIIAAIESRHPLEPVGREDANATALRYRFRDGAPGSIGVIASVTRAFCGACSRMRTTADGKVRPCLFSHEEWDLRPLLRGDGGDEAVARFLIDSMWTKQAGHGIGADGFTQPERGMSAIGG